MTTLGLCCICYFGGFGFPAEPGMLPNAGAEEQSLLWAIVVMVAMFVMFMRVRPRVLAKVGPFWSRRIAG